MFLSSRGIRNCSLNKKGAKLETVLVIFIYTGTAYLHICFYVI